MSLRIGIIGADSFHVSAFVELLLEDENFKEDVDELHVFIDKSSRMKLSTDRQARIIEQVSKFNVRFSDNIDAIRGLDAYMILTVDANTHLKHFQDLMSEGKPIFIDKPITYSYKETQKIGQLSDKHKIPVFSSSALRFSPFLKKAQKLSKTRLELIEISGPLTYQAEIEGYYWYGIHLLEMLSVFGDNIKIHYIHKNEFKELIEGSIDSKLFNVNGHLTGSNGFQVKIGNSVFNENDNEKPIYYYLLKEIIKFFRTGKSPILYSDTLKIIKKIEEINETKSNL